MRIENSKIFIKDTDLKLSRIGLGTANACIKYRKEEFFNILNEYTYYEGNLIDTANIYSNWVNGESSRSEKSIGDWLQRSHKRKDVIILTKGGHPHFYGNLMSSTSRVNMIDIRTDLENSLKNLHTDYIDIYCFHRDDSRMDVGDLIEIMETFVNEGKIRYYACSNWQVDRMIKAKEYCKQKGYRGFVANECMNNICCKYINLKDTSLSVMNSEMTKYHMKNTSIIPIGYSCICGGFLYKLNKSKNDLYESRNAIECAKLVKNIAESNAYTITQIALAYIYSQQINCIPLYEPQNHVQIREIMQWITSAGFQNDVNKIFYLLNSSI